MAAPIVVKVGTSTLTDAQGRLDRAYLYELAWQVAAMRRQGRPVVLVSSGAVRAGCERLGWTRRPQSIPLKQAAAAVGQGELIHAYNQAFGPAYPVAQVLLTRQDAADRERYVNARNTLTTLLRHGCIPIVNENDTVAVDEIRFGDNDTLAAQVAALVAAELLVLLTDVPGFLDEAGQVIPRIDTIDERIRRLAGGSGRDGSGEAGEVRRGRGTSGPIRWPLQDDDEPQPPRGGLRHNPVPEGPVVLARRGFYQRPGEGLAHPPEAAVGHPVQRPLQREHRLRGV